jgi:diguanylate cyclase (GGDEF)-like protein
MKLFTTKLAAPLIIPPIFIGIIFISMWISLSYIENNSKHSIQKSLNTVLHITEEALQLWLNGRLDELNRVVNDPQVLTLTKSLLDEYKHDKDLLNSATQARLRAFMDEKMQNNDDKGFFIIAPDRISIGSMRDINIGSENLINQQRKQFLDRAFNGEQLFVPSISSDVPLVTKNGVVRDKQPTIFIASAIKDENGQVIAVLTLRLNPMTHFTHITQLGQIGYTGETYAFDREGVLISNSRFINDLKKAGIIDYEELAMLSVRIADPGGNLMKGHIPSQDIETLPLTLMARRAIKGNVESYIEPYRGYRGEQVFGAWLWHKTLGIGLATEIDAREAMQPYRVTRIVLITMLILIFCMVIGLVFVPLWFQERQNQALKKHRDSLEDIVLKRTAQLEEANINLKALSEVDPLTQIANRRLYENTLNNAVAASVRASQSLALMIIDIDYFKPYNDNYGHDNGDVTLKEVASTIASSVTRATDLAARYGGEEFVVLMPSTDAEGAKILAQNITNQIKSRAIEHKFSSVADTITVSIGVASLTGETLNDASLFKKADQALYRAKEQGRDRIVVHENEEK